MGEAKRRREIADLNEEQFREFMKDKKSIGAEFDLTRVNMPAALDIMIDVLKQLATKVGQQELLSLWISFGPNNETDTIHVTVSTLVKDSLIIQPGLFVKKPLVS